ncbi:hypothetical protein KP806_27005 [Paenibacillus sp. N4]|uniref:hypothetical protein n=1 Tax=Paenibacillus vietnamensis TaxID=2590547 RepID=UPI001CD0668B|nr:hypothetical protein [Paenibacillus vietnamensis]MCA0758710.1 hypothetical protein [Paenibacillus vietnamensis]
MWERILVMVIAFGGVLVYDGITLRKKVTAGEKAIYAIMLVIGLYMAMDYVANQDWFDVYDLVEPVLGGVSKQIDNMLKVDWES